ncbi:Uncharacterised protein, partial [Mycoplasmoides gallisepticum]
MFLFTASLVIFQYSSVYMSLVILDSKLTYLYNFIKVFNFSNVAITANNFIPIPGGEGTIQVTLELYFQSLVNPSLLSREFIRYFDSKAFNTDINNTIFLW